MIEIICIDDSFVLAAGFVRRIQCSRIRQHGPIGATRPARRGFFADVMKFTRHDMSAREPAYRFRRAYTAVRSAKLAFRSRQNPINFVFHCPERQPARSAIRIFFRTGRILVCHSFSNNELLSALQKFSRLSPYPSPGHLSSTHIRNENLCRTFWPVCSNDVPAESPHVLYLVPTRMECILNQLQHGDAFLRPHELLPQFENQHQSLIDLHRARH